MHLWFALPLLLAPGSLPTLLPGSSPCPATFIERDLAVHVRAPSLEPGAVIIIAGPAERRKAVCGLERAIYPVVLRAVDGEPVHGELALAPGLSLVQGMQLRVRDLSRCDADPAYIAVSVEHLGNTSESDGAEQRRSEMDAPADGMAMRARTSAAASPQN